MVKECIASDIACHMGSHHQTQVNAPWLTPATKAGTWFTYPGGMDGWVDLGVLRWFGHPQMVTHPSINGAWCTSTMLSRRIHYH